MRSPIQEDLSGLPTSRGRELLQRDEDLDEHAFIRTLEPLLVELFTAIQSGGRVLAPALLRHHPRRRRGILRPRRHDTSNHGGRGHRSQEAERPREQARTALVYLENSTESPMHLQSRAICFSDEVSQIIVQTEIPEILTDKQASGYIYVLRSRSDDLRIACINDLHNHDYSRGRWRSGARMRRSRCPI